MNPLVWTESHNMQARHCLFLKLQTDANSLNKVQDMAVSVSMEDLPRLSL